MRLHPDFPVVSGDYRLSHDWRLTLPSEFNRRIEARDLIIWKPGFTLWLALWGCAPDDAPPDRLEDIRSDTSLDAFDVRVRADRMPIRYSYRLLESRGQNAVHALYAFVLKDSGQLQMAFYMDREADLPSARTIVESVR